MQCLYCGNRISLLRKLKDSEFCSDEHRDLYQQEQTALALARLTESGNRMNQQRRPVEPLEPVEDVPAGAAVSEPLDPPEPFGFTMESPQAHPPRHFQETGGTFDWLSTTALPDLFEYSPAQPVCASGAYCRPVLPAVNSTAGTRATGAVAQIECKARTPRIAPADLALDLSGAPQPVRQPAGPQYPVAPVLPVPLAAAEPPRDEHALLAEEVQFTPAAPEIVSDSGRLSFQPGVASGVPIQLKAAPPLATWSMPRVWPAMPRVTVRTLIDGPLTETCHSGIVREPGWANQAGALAPAVPQPVVARSMDACQPVPVEPIESTPTRRLPAGTEMGSGRLRLACCRMPKLDVEPGCVGSAVPDLTFAASTPFAASLPGFDATAVAGMNRMGTHVGVPLEALEPPLEPAAMAEEIPYQAARRLPEFDAPFGAGITAVAGYENVLLEAVEPPPEHPAAAGETPCQAERMLPGFAWTLDPPQVKVEGGWCSAVPDACPLPPKKVAGAGRAVPVLSRARGGRKMAARTWLPAANLPLVEPRLGYGYSMVPLATLPSSAGASGAPMPDICTFIPSRRRHEMKARIAIRSCGEYVRVRGMAPSVKLAKLNPEFAAVAGTHLAGTAVEWLAPQMPPAHPAMPSPGAGGDRQTVSIAPGMLPAMTRLFSINLADSALNAPPAKPVGTSEPHTVCRPPKLPAFPAMQDGEQMHERTSALLTAMIERLDGGAPARWALNRLWRRAPLSIKAMVGGVAILGALAAMGGGSDSQQWSNLREEIRGRAAVDLVDDFRAGMGAWNGAENWAETWSYDSAGFVQTGKLALYRPSIALSNYRFEFLGQIANKSMGWVFRAVDTRNYYAMKIVCANNGPMPTASLVRYAVIDGKPGPKTALPLPIGARTDMMCRIRVDAEGSNFTAQFQDQVVDVWSDNRLAAGGVGFFSDKGERAKIRWIEVSHHSDFLGKLCAYLVPFDARSADRSVTR